MYSGGKCTCGKRRESEIACTAAGIIPAEREGRAKTHVTLRELYVRKLPGTRKRMYRYRECTCRKGGVVEWACMSRRSGNLCADVGVEIEGC